MILAGLARRSRRPISTATTIADLMAGQHSDPLRVIMFNPETNRSEDVSHAIVQEILRRLVVTKRGRARYLRQRMPRPDALSSSMPPTTR